MKRRRPILLLGVAAVFGIGTCAAYKNPWVCSQFARDAVDPAEIERGRAAGLPNHAPAAAECGYPQWRGASRQGVAPVGPFRTDWDTNKPKELWRVPVGAGYGSCAVVGGKVYVQDHRGDTERVMCLDAMTGKQLWEHASTVERIGTGLGYETGSRATPTVSGNAVYAVGAAGKLLALEPAGKGVKVLWEHELLSEFAAPMPEWGVACSPLVLGELVIVLPGGKKGAVVAFDRRTGDVR
ncbi:MAG: PQQ-binding-like beta-propeller repeat protein, partial [Gemmata sp.]